MVTSETSQHHSLKQRSCGLKTEALKAGSTFQVLPALHFRLHAFQLGTLNMNALRRLSTSFCVWI
jgi:hypothetical protein